MKLRIGILAVLGVALAGGLVMGHPHTGIWGTLFLGGVGVILLFVLCWLLVLRPVRAHTQESAPVIHNDSQPAMVEHEFTSRYEVGIALAIFTEVMGWLLVIGSAVAALPLAFLYGPLFAVYALLFFPVGLGFMQMAYITKATMETADHTREVMNLLAAQSRKERSPTE